MSNAVCVIMAAGQGKRMKSDLPKVLVEVLGRPMVHFVLDAVAAAGITRSIVVVGYKADDVQRELQGREGVSFALQAEQKGTGHAVMMCADQLQGHDGPVLVLTGDSPLVQTSSLTALLDAYRRDQPACILGTTHKEDPTGLGRILRDDHGDFVGIVEQKDATDEEQQITEVNMSTYVFHGPDLLEALPLLRDNNKQGEYYITDCPAVLKQRGKLIRAEPVLKSCEALSINTVEDLQVVEEEMKRLGM